MKTIVCYTCCTGGYDSFLEHTTFNNEWDYVYFTDNKDLIAQKKIGMWNIKPLAYTKSTPVKQNRWHKTHPHVLFPEYKYSLYIDSNISIQTNRVFKKINDFITQGVLIAIPRHPKRDCIYKEAIKIKKEKIDHAKIVDKEMSILRKAHYPENNGLYENNVIFRQHNEKNIKKAMDQWWKMIYHYSKRDQLSLNYIMWKNKISVTPFYEPYENHHENGDFEFIIGEKHTQNKITNSNKEYWNIYLFGHKIFSYKPKIVSCNAKHKKIKHLFK